MKDQQVIEQTLDSREVAEMVEKDHSKLIRDIRRYKEQFNQANIGLVDFFRESVYEDAKGELRPCYDITLKGCEFIAHKLTGVKGTAFTARYINRFHEMQERLTEQDRGPELPWFIRKFRGNYIVLERDFIQITGVDVKKHKLFYRQEYFSPYDINGWGWKCDREKFKQEYGFDFGEDNCMNYFYLSGVKTALRLLASDKSVEMKPGSYELLMNEAEKFQRLELEELRMKKSAHTEQINVNPKEQMPIQITVNLQVTGQTPDGYKVVEQKQSLPYDIHRPGKIDTSRIEICLRNGQHVSWDSLSEREKAEIAVQLNNQMVSAAAFYEEMYRSKK